MAASKIISIIPNMSFLELLQLFINAVNCIAKEENVALAEQVLNAISGEWNCRQSSLSNRGWFQWPTTDAPSGANGISSETWYKAGMLTVLGYHVGARAVNTSERHRILTYIFQEHLPPINSLEYMNEWGDPGTSRRLSKLSNPIASHLRNAKRNRHDRTNAITDWEDDLTFLYNKFYVGHFRFAWPDGMSIRNDPLLSQILQGPFSHRRTK